jgi:hypothetical protein
MLSVKAIYSVNTLGGAEPIPINQIECYKLEEWTTEWTASDFATNYFPISQ